MLINYILLRDRSLNLTCVTCHFTIELDKNGRNHYCSFGLLHPLKKNYVILPPYVRFHTKIVEVNPNTIIDIQLIVDHTYSLDTRNSEGMGESILLNSVGKLIDPTKE